MLTARILVKAYGFDLSKCVFFFFKESELNSLSGQVAQVRCFYPFETGVNYLPIHYFNGHIVLFKWNLCKGNA